MVGMDDDWSFLIFVPEPEQGETPPDIVEKHAKNGLFPRIGRVVKVSAQGVEDQWARTVDTLMKLSASISEKSKEWTIDEVEVGLTLSAKGELLFIAEAGAEASIKFILKRAGGRPAP